MTEQIDYRQEVIVSVNNEFNDFYNAEMQKPKEDVFANAHKIFAYTALKNFLTAEETPFSDDVHYRCLYEEKGSILALLYDEYLNNEYVSLSTNGDIVEFIEDDYNKTFHNDVLEEESELG